MATRKLKKRKAKSKAKSNATKWKFQVVLWDNARRILLVKKFVTVSRVSRFTAKEYVQRQYPSPYIVELY